MKSIYAIISMVFLGSILLIVLSACSETDAKEDKAKADIVNLPTTNNRVLGVGRIEPQNGILNLTAGTDGKVVELIMDENQQVQKGQALVNIEMAIENAQLRQAQSKLSTQKAAIASSQANLEALKISFQQAQLTYTRNQKLYEAKAQTRQALDESKAQMDRLSKEVEGASASWLEAGNRLKELEADVDYYRTLVAQKQVRAPVDGKILRVDINTGDYVAGSTQIGVFAAAGPLIAKTEIDELYAERVRKGQKAYLFSQTTGDTLAAGMVSFTAEYFKQKSLFEDESTELEDRRVREVHILLEAGSKPLVGSRVDCLIVLE
jgi:multidrug resistance efflux pump